MRNRDIYRVTDILRILLTLPASVTAAVIAYVCVGLVLKSLQIMCTIIFSNGSTCEPPDMVSVWILFFLLGIACSAAWVLAGFFMSPNRSRRTSWLVFGSGAMTSLLIAAYFGLANLKLINYVMGATILLSSWATGIALTLRLNHGIKSNV